MFSCSGFSLPLLVFAILAWSVSATAAEKPVAAILGKAVHSEELTPPDALEQKKKMADDAYAAWLAKAQQEKVRTIVWTAVFGDYSAKRKIEPTAAEIESQIRQQQKFMKEDRLRREKDRQGLIKELASQGITETRRQQAQQYLDTLNSLRKHDARMDKERSKPEFAKIQQESQRRVSAVWVKQWKVNQALYREFGGRIVFQQAGWEPIDAYRKLLEQYEARKDFVVHKPALREAVYSYFQHKFVYADEQKARFYFEKPYWERTDAEMKAAGLKLPAASCRESRFL
jgi:hypothetical protein